METLKKIWVTMEPCGDKPGYYSPTGFHMEKPEKSATYYNVADPNEFIKHMRVFLSLPDTPINRKQYEKLCHENDIEPIEDKGLGGYGMEYGNYRMSHYHTNPGNRKIGITNTLHQLRYRSVKKEGVFERKAINIKEKKSLVAPKKTGQLFEPCQCGGEPVYMPLHLCDECWPK